VSSRKVSRHRTLITPLGLAFALLVAPALSGCSVIEGLIEQASGGQVDVSAGHLPDGWPTDVPITDGDIIGGGVANDNDGKPVWNVTIRLTGGQTNEQAFAAISAQLLSAGFATFDLGDLDGTADVTSGGFKNDTYGVFVAVAAKGPLAVANYTVVEGIPRIPST
jgi:hypothetical protein